MTNSIRVQYDSFDVIMIMWMNNHPMHTFR